VLRRIFGPKRDEVTGNGENYIVRSLRKKIGRVFKNRGLRKIFQHKMEAV
jgi:hypothetical protein